MQKGFILKFFLIIAGGVLLCGAFFQSLVAPPIDFPVPYHLTIERGQSLFSVSRELKDAGLIRSPRIFEIGMLTFGSDKNISEGEYYFTAPTNVFTIALRISGKQFGIDKKKVTFPEGFSNTEMSRRLVATFPEFDEALFLKLAEDDQGYLFPDTYRFFPTVQPDAVISTMNRTFDAKMLKYESDIAASKYTKEQIIIMASIIEKEARGENDRATVAGILWKRLDMGIALQVDAPFLYLLGKESKELTREDLAINSPYNTYRNKGLPPTPINNPGLAAIDAVLHPVASPYLFYLHDAQGDVYYAVTYEEHKKNIRLYLQ